jgi:hypothetical protein
MKKFRSRDVIARETRTRDFPISAARSRGGQRGSAVRDKAVQGGVGRSKGEIAPGEPTRAAATRWRTVSTPGPSSVSLPRGRTRCLHLGGQRDSRSARGTRARGSFASRSALVRSREPRRRESGQKGFFFHRDWIRYFRQYTAGVYRRISPTPPRERRSERLIFCIGIKRCRKRTTRLRVYLYALNPAVFSLFLSLPLSPLKLTLRRYVSFNLTRWRFPIRDTPPDGPSSLWTPFISLYGHFTKRSRCVKTWKSGVV